MKQKSNQETILRDFVGSGVTEIYYPDGTVQILIRKRKRK